MNWCENYGIYCRIGLIIVIGSIFGVLGYLRTETGKYYGWICVLEAGTGLRSILFEEQNLQIRRAERAQRACRAPDRIHPARITRVGTLSAPSARVICVEGSAWFARTGLRAWRAHAARLNWCSDSSGTGARCPVRIARACIAPGPGLWDIYYLFMLHGCMIYDWKMPRAR